MQPLPITLICGLSGAGKSTLIRSLLERQSGLNIATLGPHPFFEKAYTLSHETEDEHPTGAAPAPHTENACQHVMLDPSLLEQIREVALEGTADALVLEATGGAEPMAVAEAIVHEMGHSDNEDSAPLFELDTLVTVIDAPNFLYDYRASETIQTRVSKTDAKDGRTVTDALIAQVEFADVIVVNKTDLLSTEELDTLLAFLERLNPGAMLIPAQYGEVPVEEIISTGQFDPELTAARIGWSQALDEENEEEASEPDAFGFSTFVYRAREPFHPERLWDHFQEPWDGVLRSQGFFWIASQPDAVGVWSQGGGVSSIEPAGLWLAATPQEEWDIDEEEQDRIREIWDEEFGDRMQEIVLIGQHMDHERLTAELDACLLTPAELAKGRAHWLKSQDPFPELS